MKHFKVSLALLAVVLAVAASAFTTVNKTSSNHDLVSGFNVYDGNGQSFSSFSTDETTYPTPAVSHDATTQIDLSTLDSDCESTSNGLLCLIQFHDGTYISGQIRQGNYNP